MDLNELKDKSYKLVREHGFHDKKLSDDYYLMLVLAEAAKAFEADQKGKYFKGKMVFGTEFNRYSVISDEEKRFICAFEKCIKDTVSDKLVDVVIYLLALASLRDIDLKDSDEAWEEIISSIRPDAKNIYSFAELMFNVCKNIIIESDSIENTIYTTLGLLKVICYIYEIDIEWHIEQKIRYNFFWEKIYGAIKN